ncbi:L-type lectin-domain containing receptor kinase IX.1-like [Pyrus communis]|uniref:L-type lectin-domain containing receptor kinase IX.1-like n=1 Tax=Pyrus communis TaxID=23211 RepID=UPI0035C1986D
MSIFQPLSHKTKMDHKNSPIITPIHSPNHLLFAIALLLLFHYATPLTYNFSSFPNSTINSSISLEGDAYTDGQFIQLAKIHETAALRKNGSVGRVTYREPFLLRENATGKLADFTTHFTFEMDPLSNTYADGLAFFVAPNGSLLNRTLGRGGSLGLPVEHLNLTLSRSQYPFVAVEFDIYRNGKPSIDDPYGDHVGIDINSLKSYITKPWNGSLLDGKQNGAWISYNSGSKNLSVAFTSYVNGGQLTTYLDYVVDLEQYLPDWVIVGFSAASGARTTQFMIKSWSFNSTLVPPPRSSSGSNNIALAVGLGLGGFIAFVLGLSFVWCLLRKKKARGKTNTNEDPTIHELINGEFGKGTGPRMFSYKELAFATSNFAGVEKLGEGGFGGVYRGYIKDLKSYVAVKKISSKSKQGLKEFASEVRIISQLRHRNLVQLIGWCHKKKLLLVYEFMPNGSLDSHLFTEKCLLLWGLRYKIAQGLASGLLYLHQEWEQCVLHRDIKSSNVMLDSNFNAKLGDFGLARLVDHGKQSKTTIVAGTRGYMALEYVITGKASKESDVYSFGIVALEIACGRKPIDLSLESSQVEMVEWVWELYGEGKVIEAADPKLHGDFDEKEMECLLIVGLWCAHPDYHFRPSIQQAIQVLNFEVLLPILPSNMPVATYLAPPVVLSSDTSTTTSYEKEQTSHQSSGSAFSYRTGS